VTAVIQLAYKQALHLGEAREVAREQHAKEDASAGMTLECSSRSLHALAINGELTSGLSFGNNMK